MREIYTLIFRKCRFFAFALPLFLGLLSTANLKGQSQTFNSSGVWFCPAGVTSVTVECWGAGGSGGTRTSNGVAGGGGGGAYSMKVISVVPGTLYSYTVGEGASSTSTSPGGDSWFQSAAIVMAKGGNSVATNSATRATGGAASAGVGTIRYSGGDGKTGNTSGTDYGGGGGSSAGTGANGVTATNQNGATAPAGGGDGGDGRYSTQGNGLSGSAPGGGGGGALRTSNSNRSGGSGANGQVRISYSPAGSYKSLFTGMSIGSSTWCAGETRTVTVTVKNNGTAPWADIPGVQDINIGVKWDGDPDYLVRTDAGGLTPGATGTFSFNVTAPAAGTNHLTFDVVYEAVSWFGNNNGGVGPANVVSTSPALTIISAPTQPSTITGTTAVCAGSSQIYSVTNVVGVTYAWNTPAGWTLNSGQGTNSVTYTVGSSDGTVQVTPSNGCGNGTARTLAVAVTSGPPAQPSAISGGTTVCPGSTQTYSVTNISGITYTWNIPSGWTISSGQGTNSVTYTVGASGGTVQVTPSNTCGNGTAQTKVITVNPLPAVPSGTGNARCGTGTVIISATPGPGETIDWYANANGGSPLTGGTGTTSFTTPSISGTTVYYAQARNITTGCISSSRQAVTATVDALPTSTGINGSNCGTGTVTISANPSAGATIDWYSANSGGTLLLSNSNSYTTPAISGTNIYYAQARNTTTGCLSASRTAVTATINTIPSAPTGVTSGSNCGTGTVTISVANPGTGLTIDWYANAAGGSPLLSGNRSFTTSTISGTTTYYAETRNTTTGCVSATRTPVIATINPLPAAPTGAIGSSRCGTGTVALSVDNPGSGFAIDWYAGPTGGSVLSGGSNTTTYNTPNISGTTIYYAQARNTATGCVSATRTAVIATINSIPAAPTITSTASSICQGSNVTFYSGIVHNDPPATFTSTGSNATITDNSSTGAYKTLNVSGIPANAIVNKIEITLTAISEDYNSDLTINVKAPNSKILNLLNRTAKGSGFTNTVFSSDGTALISANDAPYTGTFKADAGNSVNAGSANGGGNSNITSFAGLYSTAGSLNGTWQINVRDNNSQGGSGSLSNWSVTIYYTVSDEDQPVVWSPQTDLFTDAAGTNAYTGDSRATVYFIPSTSGNKTYTATTTTGAGCNNSSNVSVNVIGIATGTLTASASTICEGESITFTAPAASAYTFYVDGEAVQGPSLSRTFSTSTLTAGTHQVMVDVANSANCGAMFGPITVIVNALPTPTLSATKTTICTNESVTFTASGGTSYVFKVNGSPVQGGTSNTYTTTTLTNGASVTVDVTDGNSCKATSDTVVMTVNALPVGTLATTETSGTTPNDKKVCVGDEVTFIATVGAGNTYDFKIGGVSVYTGPSNTFVTSFSTAGNPVVTVDVTNASGCSATFGPAQVILVSALPSGSLTASENSGTPNNNEICPGTSVTFTATAGSGNNYKFYLNGTGAPLYNGSSNTYSTTTLVDGDYLTVTVTNSNGCAATYTSPLITVVPAPVGSLSADATTICAGGSIEFTATEGFANYNFRVNGVSFQNGPSNTASHAGFTTGDVITVEVSNAATCTAVFNSLTITVNPLPTGSLTVAETSGNTNNDGIICTGANVVFTATAGFANYNFKLNGTTIQYSASNTYSTNTLSDGDVVSVEVTSATGCAASFNNSNITVHPYPVVAPITGTQEVCVGGTTTFANVTPDGNWSSAQPTVATVDAAGIVTGVASGTTTISYKVMNANGCETIVTRDVTVNALPVVAAITGPSSVCIGSNITLADATAGGTWSSADDGIATVDASGVVTGISDGTVVISYTVTNSNGCITVVTKNITVNLLPVVPAITGTTSVCVNSTTSLSNTTTGGVWSSADAGIATVNASTGLVTGVSDGTVTISYKVTNSNGCSVTVTTDVTVNALPEPTLVGPNPICLGSTDNVYTTEADQFHYTWNVTNGTVTSGGTDGNNTITISWLAPGPKSISVNYEDANGCAGATVATVQNAPGSSPTISGPASACQNSTGNVYTTETGKIDYSWTVNGGTITDGEGTESVTVTWNVAGAKSITVNYADPGGCSAATPTVKSVTVNPLPTIIIHDPAAVCSPATVNLTAAAITAGSTSGLTYTYWTDEAATVSYTTPTTAGAGIYYIKGTTPSGCFDIKPVTVTVNPTPSVAITDPEAVCSPATVDLTNVEVTSGSTTGLTFTYWTNSTATLSYTTPATAGAGTYYIKGTTPEGCYDIKPVTVTVNPKPTVVIHNPAALCSPATADLTLATITTGSTPGLTYTYWTDALATVSYTTPATATAGTYYIKGTTAAGCYDIQQVTVTVNPTPTVVVTNPAAVCSPATVNLTSGAVTAGSTSGLTYTYWTDAAATVSYATPATAGAGTYYIKGTTASGCYDIKPVTVTVNPTPSVVITNPAAVCSPATVNLTAGTVTAGSTSGLTYTYWTNAAATVSYATPATAGAGTYYIKGTTASGCYDIKPVIVTVNPLPTLVITDPAPVCAPATVNLTAAAITAGSTSGLTLTYWTNATATTSYATPATAGAGTYYIKGTSTAGCYDIKPVTVIVNDPPAPFLIDPTSATICLGDVVPLSASGATASSGSVTFNSTSNNLAIPDDSNTGAVSTINVSGIPAGAVITSVSVNFNVTHGYDAELILNLKAPNGKILNLVNERGGNGNNFTNTTVNSVSNNPFTSNGAPFNGTYRPDRASNVGANGNVSNVTAFSSLYDTPNGNWSFSAKDNVGCNGFELFGFCIGDRYDNGVLNNWSITINYTLPNSPLSVTWSPVTDLYTDPGATTAYTGTSLSTVYAKPATSGNKTYTATVTNAAGCSTSENVSITVNPTPVVNIFPNYCAIPGKVRLTATSVPAATSYVWSTGETTSSIDVDVAGTFDVTVLSGSGCPGTASIDVARELVTNGDFEAGDGGFTTLYTSHTGSFYNGSNASGLWPEGYYAVDKNAYSPSNGTGYHPNFHGKDHTTGSGKFMMVNGSVNLRTIWEQTVQVLPNTTYYFSAWGMNLNPGSPARLRFAVNGQETGSIAELNNAPKPGSEGEVNTGNWIRFYGTWTSGPATTSAVINIVNLNTDPGGNDFGLDDISFGTLSTFIELISAPGTDAQTVCANTPLTDIVYRAGNGDPAGPNVTGLPAGITHSFVGDKLTFSGTPTVPGNYTYTITTTGCAPYSVTGTINVQSQTLTLSAGTSSPTLCINSPLTPIEYTIGGSAIGASLTSGTLPAGVSGTFNAGKFTITGTPSVAGIYPYTITTTGDCYPATISGTITVQQQEITLTSGIATQEICVDEAISTIVYTVGGTGTNAGVTGLPPGVSGFYSGGAFIITGTPTAAGTYNYTVTTSGTCAPGAELTGSIIVNPAATITLSSAPGTDNQAACINAPLTPIAYSIGGGGTNATVSGLPAGVTGSYSSGVLTIDGTPSVAGTFTYTVTTTGTCAQATKTGTITVNIQTIALTSGNASPTLCLGSTLTDIVFTIGGTAANATLTGSLPNGITGSVSGNVFTISGSPTELGTFNYTVTTTGNCATASVNGTIVINTGSIGGTLPDLVSVCSGVTGTLNLTGNTGNVTRWESSIDNGSTWTNIANTTTTLPYVNITAPTQYRALVKSGSCNAVYSTVALVGIHNYWTGTVSADWNDPANWSDNQIPSTSCPDAYIPAGAPNQPVLGDGMGTVNNIHIYSGATLTVNGAGTLQIAGNITNNGTFDATNGAIEFKGTTAQTISGGTFKDKTIKDLKISNSNGLSLSATANDTLNITGMVSFGVSNAVFTTHDNLTLKSTAAGTASVGVLSPGNDITGNVVVERFVNVGTQAGNHGKSWQFVATPTRGQTVRDGWMEGGNMASTGYGTQIIGAGGPAQGFDAASNLPSLKYYDYNSEKWVGISSAYNQAYDKRGYMLFVRGDRSTAFPDVTRTTLRTKGTLFTPSRVPDVTTVVAGKFESVGNPYASAIDMKKIGITGGAAPIFIVWDPLLGGAYGLGAFQTFAQTRVNGLEDDNFYPNPGGGSYGSFATPNNFIQSGQAFFAQATGTDGTVSFNENAKASGSRLVFRGGRTGEAHQVMQLRANLYGVNADKSTFLTDGNLIQFGEEFSNKIDGLDARKQLNSAENLGIKSGDKELVIERRHDIRESDTIFYSLTGVIVQNYLLEFTASDLSGFGVEGYVEDTYLDTQTPLNMDGVTKLNFAVTSAAGSKAANRFRIVFRQAPVIVLPVTFVSVRAIQKDTDIAVEWKVENEQDIQQYEVERSSDGVNFNKVATVAALNNGTQNYQWLDEHPVTGTNYYRIRSVGRDGKVAYSTIANVAMVLASPSIGIYPNPITDGIIHLQLINQPEGMYGLRLLNSLGQVIVSKQVGHAGGNATENIRWDYNLAHGVYHLEVTKPNGEIVVIKVMY